MEKVLKRLFEMQDLKYRDFSAKLIPTVSIDSIIGVRSPQMGVFAKEFTKDKDKFEFLKELPHKYLEENNLHASLIGSISNDINEVLSYIEEFLPYVDNWATCDTMPPKIFKKYPQEVYSKIQEWLKSSHVYTVRFAVVTLLGYYLDEFFDPEMLTTLACIHSQEYYINMAIAWYYSFALIKQYDKTILLFESKTLDKWIHNKSIQKAIESYRIEKTVKEYLKCLKI